MSARSVSKVRVILSLLCVCLALVACTQREAKPSALESRTHYGPLPNFTRFNLSGNPCGGLTIRPPLHNVTGHVDIRGSVPGWVYLHILPNTTPEAVAYVPEHCARLGRVPINRTGEFTFPSLPSGDYVAVVWKNSTRDEPVVLTIKEYNRSGVHILPHFSTDNEQRSTVTFSVRYY